MLATCVKGACSERSSSNGVAESPSNFLQNLNHYNTVTLPHLLATVMHWPASFPCENIALIVIDDVSTPFENISSQHGEEQFGVTKKEVAERIMRQRQVVRASFISRLNKLAVLLNIAVLLTSKTLTKVRAESGASLLPTFSGADWESNVGTRVALFRNWAPIKSSNTVECQDQLRKIRYAVLVKGGGTTISNDCLAESVVPFTIGDGGMEEVQVDSTGFFYPRLALPVKARKRPHAEIADSEESGEEYGWADQDEVAAEGLIEEGRLMKQSVHSL